MTGQSKLQIRAKLLSIISHIKTLKEYTEDNIKKITEELKKIDDSHVMFDIFIKEYIKMDENEFLFWGCIIKELVDIDYIQDSVFDILKSSTYSDEAKYKLVMLLRILGAEFDYNAAPEYFENPADVLDTDTKKMLEKAVFNPEAMLDFLDFVSAVQKRDRNLLLQSLQKDYEGDMLANIVYPILYSDFDDDFKIIAIEILINAKSSLAIEPFKYLIETSDNDEIKNLCVTGLKKLKLAGASEAKAEKYFKNIIKETVLASCYTTIPDGNGNQALIVSRMNENNLKFMLSAIVINDKYGIEDCFGFYNISEDELLKILNKFYQSEGQYQTLPSYVKTRINDAFCKTVKNKYTFPYEFICWEALIKDIEPFENSVKSEIEKIVKPAVITKDELLELLTKNYSFRWYIKPAENKEFEQLVNTISNKEELNIKEINSLLKEQAHKIFDEETLVTWKDRILQCIYLLYTNKHKKDAESFYAMFNSDDYMQIFKMVIIQRSVYNYFFSLRESAKEFAATANIFRKKQIQKEKIDLKKVESILEFLSVNWIHD